jgi:uncharacterized protein (TIGR02147 family)
MEIERPNIYDYANPREFLQAAVRSQQSQEKATLRSLARAMELGSHSLLLMLLQGKRPLRLKHVRGLAQGLKLSSHERLYLQALIQFDQADSPEEKELCTLWLSDLHPGERFRSVEVDDFRIVSHWVHSAILALTHTQGFKLDSQWIASRLGHELTADEVQAAIERLQDRGLLLQDESGQWKASVSKLSSPDDVLNRGVQEFHKKISMVASEAVQGQSVDQREFQSFSIPISETQIPLAKEMIRKFRAQLAQALKTDQATQVYQVNLQLFRLTESLEHPNLSDSKDEGVDARESTRSQKGSKKVGVSS